MSEEAVQIKKLGKFSENGEFIEFTLEEYKEYT